MPQLPVRDLSQVKLADLFESPGCPVCRAIDASVGRYVDGFLYESVNDVGFRRRLDTSRGFCGPHTHQVVTADRALSGGMLGSAILLGAIARIRASELTDASTARGWSRRRKLSEASRQPDCLVCDQASQVEATTTSTLVRLSADETWAAAVGAADVCLRHLLALMAASDRPPTWVEVERRQLLRVERLRSRLDAFAHLSSHDRRHRITAAEQTSVGEATSFLGGTEGRKPPDRSRPG